MKRWSQILNLATFELRFFLGPGVLFLLFSAITLGLLQAHHVNTKLATDANEILNLRQQNYFQLVTLFAYVFVIVSPFWLISSRRNNNLQRFSLALPLTATARYLGQWLGTTAAMSLCLLFAFSVPLIYGNSSYLLPTDNIPIGIPPSSSSQSETANFVWQDATQAQAIWLQPRIGLIDSPLQSLPSPQLAVTLIYPEAQTKTSLLLNQQASVQIPLPNNLNSSLAVRVHTQHPNYLIRIPAEKCFLLQAEKNKYVVLAQTLLFSLFAWSVVLAFGLFVNTRLHGGVAFGMTLVFAIFSHIPTALRPATAWHHPIWQIFPQLNELQIQPLTFQLSLPLNFFLPALGSAGIWLLLLVLLSFCWREKADHAG